MGEALKGMLEGKIGHAKYIFFESHDKDCFDFGVCVLYHDIIIGKRYIFIFILSVGK